MSGLVGTRITTDLEASLEVCVVMDGVLRKGGSWGEGEEGEVEIGCVWMWWDGK
jgi:hypothetical protein